MAISTSPVRDRRAAHESNRIESILLWRRSRRRRRRRRMIFSFVTRLDKTTLCSCSRSWGCFLLDLVLSAVRLVASRPEQTETFW